MSSLKSMLPTASACTGNTCWPIGLDLEGLDLRGGQFNARRVGWCRPAPAPRRRMTAAPEQITRNSPQMHLKAPPASRQGTRIVCRRSTVICHSSAAGAAADTSGASVGMEWQACPHERNTTAGARRPCWRLCRCSRPARWDLISSVPRRRRAQTTRRRPCRRKPYPRRCRAARRRASPSAATSSSTGGRCSSPRRSTLVGATGIQGQPDDRRRRRRR